MHLFSMPPLYTKDLDLWIQTDHTNAEAIIILPVSIRCFDLFLPQKVVSNARICESGSQNLIHAGGNDAKNSPRCQN